MQQHRGRNKQIFRMNTIFLIGYMGCGKTTLGRALAAEAGMDFLDLDEYIEEKYETTITDLFARMGGDEFSVLFYGCGAEVAERKMEGLHNRIASKALSEHGTGGGLSYGVVAFQPGMTPESMLEAADAAMYACKRRHREQPGYRSNR